MLFYLSGSYIVTVYLLSSEGFTHLFSDETATAKIGSDETNVDPSLTDQILNLIFPSFEVRDIVDGVNLSALREAANVRVSSPAAEKGGKFESSSGGGKFKLVEELSFVRALKWFKGSGLAKKLFDKKSLEFLQQFSKAMDEMR